MLEEPAMFKPLSYSSEFVSIRQSLVLSTDNASFKAKNIRAGSPDLFMSMMVSWVDHPLISTKWIVIGVANTDWAIRKIE